MGVAGARPSYISPKSGFTMESLPVHHGGTHTKKNTNSQLKGDFITIYHLWNTFLDRGRKPECPENMQTPGFEPASSHWNKSANHYTVQPALKSREKKDAMVTKTDKSTEGLTCKWFSIYSSSGCFLKLYLFWHDLYYIQCCFDLVGLQQFLTIYLKKKKVKIFGGPLDMLAWFTAPCWSR